MRTPHALLIGVLVAATGCRDSSGPVGGNVEFFAIDGAAQPAVTPGDTITCEGNGFGNTQGNGLVLVTTASGLASAEVVEWRDDQVRARLPDEAQSGSVFVVVDRGDSLGPLPLFVRLRDPFVPQDRPWSEAARAPRALWGAAATALRYPSDSTLTSLVVLTAGISADGELTDSTYLGTADATGTIVTWIAAPDTLVPQPRYHHAMTGADRLNAPLTIDGVAYMIGGIDTAGRVLPDVLGIGVNSLGEYGLWTSLTPLPGGRAGAGVTTGLGKIIVVGGFGPDSLASRVVQVASVNEDGTINGWFEGPALPEGRAFPAVVTYGRKLYVIGGETGLVSPDTIDPQSPDLRASVYAITLSPRSGFFADTAWTELPVALSVGRTRHAAFVLDSALVVTGGVYPGAPSGGETEFALIRPDGSLTPFAQSGQTPIADLGGGTLRGAAAPLLWNARGGARATLIGGRQANGELSHSVWWH